MKDESHLPVSEQSLVFRLRKRAEIRRQLLEVMTKGDPELHAQASAYVMGATGEV